MSRRLLLIGIGLLTLLVVVGGLFVAAKADPRASTLASTLDTEGTIAFIRTKDRTVLTQWVKRLTLTLPPEMSVAKIPEGRFYELAFMHSPGGDPLPVLRIHQTTTYETLMPRKSAALAPTTHRSSVLSSSPLFRRYVGKDTFELVWMKSDALPLPKDDIGALARATLLGAEHVLLLPQENGGMIVADGLINVPPAVGRRIESSLSGSALTVSSGAPAGFAEALMHTLQDTKPDLAEGLTGIVTKAMAERNLLDETGAPLAVLRSPLSISMDGTTLTLLGMAAHRTDIDTLADSVSTHAADIAVRTLTFFKENTRTDIRMAGTGTTVVSTETQSGWTIQSLSDDLHLARQGTRFLLSNDAVAVHDTIASPILSRPASLIHLSAKRADLTEWVHTSFPFVADDLNRWMLSVLPSNTGHIELDIRKAGGGTMIIEWRVL